jgi:TRAP-type C4-dicarboxylate transport system permease large subunit
MLDGDWSSDVCSSDLKPIAQVARAVLPAVLAIFLGSLTISLLPFLATWLPGLFGV